MFLYRLINFPVYEVKEVAGEEYGEDLISKQQLASYLDFFLSPKISIFLNEQAAKKGKY